VSVLDDAADLIAAEISHIGLSADGETEMSGGGYEHQVPTYAPASGGVADLADTLAFDGPPDFGPVTHLVFKRDGAVWSFRAADDQVSFDGAGRLYLPVAPVAQEFA